MATFDSGQAPPGKLPELATWLWGQFNRVAAALREPEPRAIVLTKLAAAPDKVRDGLTVYADGANWNPGAGQGVYTYYSGAWNKLG